MPVGVLIVIEIAAVIGAADTGGSPAVVLLIAISGKRLLMLLDDLERISDLRSHDVVGDEGGVVGGVGLSVLGHLQSEESNVVVVLADRSGTADISDIDSQDTVDIAFELGLHAEVLGLLSPGENLGVTGDEGIVIVRSERKVGVDMIAGLGGDGLGNEVAVLDGPSELSVVILLLSHVLELILVGFDILGPSLVTGGLLGLPLLILAVEFLLIDRLVDSGREALDLETVDTVNNNARNEDEAGGAARELDLELLLTDGDGQSVGLSVELDINVALGKD